MDRGTATRLIAAAVLIAYGLRALRRHPPLPQPPLDRPGTAKPPETGRNQRWRSRAGSILVLLSVLVIAAAVYLAFQLTRQPGIPPAAGTASLLVPANPFTPSDRFQLMMVMDQPDAEYIEYHVTAGCGTAARHVLLVLSGNARLLHPRYVLSAGLTVTERTAQLAQPWFLVPQDVEVFDIPVGRMPCPRGVTPGQLGSAAAIGGWIPRTFEVSADSVHAMQLPLVGDTIQADTYIPSLGGFWAAPVSMPVAVDAGPLPLYDRVDVTRPGLTDTGALTWSGQSYLRPSATWTDEASSSRNQFLVLILGALIGIAGSVPVTFAMEWAREHRQATRAMRSHDG